MKEKGLKYLTFAVITVITLLQLLWLINTYSILEKELKQKGNTLLHQAIKIELFNRMNSDIELVPLGDTLFLGYISGLGGTTEDIILLQENFSNYGSEISISELDSIYYTLLNSNNIYSKHSINLIEDNVIIKSTVKDDLSSFGTIKSEYIALRNDESLKLQAILINPYWDIFRDMGLLLVATFIMALFVGFSIIYQIRIIIKQNLIAQLREDLSLAMTHEMKTPLTSIIMALRILISGKLDDKPEKKEKYFKIMNFESNKLLSLVDRFLNSAKLENKGIILNKVNVRINPIINDLIDKFQTISDKPVKFIPRINIEHVYADVEYFTDALTNIIENAIKYSGESVEIIITCENKNNYSHIKIRDNGLGISHSNLVKIFEKFERADASKRSGKGGATGFGIGLSYAQQIIKAHKGTIEVESIKGEYSEFTIKLPNLIEEL